MLTDHEQHQGDPKNANFAYHIFKCREHMFELFQIEEQGYAYMYGVVKSNHVGLSSMQLWPSKAIPEPWPPPVSDIISSSEEVIQPRIWFFKSNEIDVTVPLKALVYWSLFIDCFSIGQWRSDTVKIGDEVGAFALAKNYLLGSQLYSLSLATKAVESQVTISVWRNVRVSSNISSVMGP